MAVERASVAGRYDLIDLIARGGMAEVYRARSFGVEGFEKTVVIKRILPEFSENRRFVEMFINEAKIAVNLSHANIVQVFDLGRDEKGLYYIAMEYVAGMDMADMLRRCLARGHSFPVELAVYCAAEACKGLEYAHRRRGPDLAPLNIVHRDVSPHNLLVSFEGEVKLTDFGIARAKNAVVEPSTSAVQGKFSYMAPEQAAGAEVDGRADIFSLGVVLYEVLTGVNPFRDASGQKTLERVRKGQSIPIQEVKPDIAPELRKVVETAIAPAPDDRYGNAGRFYEDLIAFLYTSSLRVGAHDLAQFVHAMRDAPRAPDGQDMIEILGSAAPVHASAAATGLGEITDRQVPVSSDREKTRTPSISTGAIDRERRDTTALCVDCSAAANAEAIAAEARRIVERDGGRPAIDHPEYLVALFGLADADGRDAEAAARAALKIRRVARHLSDGGGKRVGMAVRGVRVVVDAAGAVEEDEGYRQAVRHLREAATKAAGLIVADRATQRQLAGRFETSDAAAAVNASPGEAWAVEGEKPIAASALPLLGRRDAIRAIAEHLTDAVAGRHRIVSLVGDPGIGRSRLLAEVARRLRARYDAFWCEARCTRQQAAQPYSALASIVRSVLGLDETDPQAAVRERLRRLRELRCPPEEVEAVGAILGLPGQPVPDPADRGRVLRGAFLRILGALAAERTTVLVVHDAVWLDADSVAAFDAFVRLDGRLRVLAFLTYRTGEEMRWRGRPCHREVALGPLDDADCQRLVLALLGDPPEPPWQLLRDVVQKSGGNPLFAEEYLKALEAAGAIVREGPRIAYLGEPEGIEIPKTLRGIVGARLGQIDAEHRALLRVAAVMGSMFRVDLLARVAGLRAAAVRRYLEEFERRGLLSRASIDEYAFGHDLVREVAYDSLTFSDRRDLHERVAQAIEAIHADRLGEFYEVLAGHYRESGAREKAVEYLLLNGERLAREYSHEAALHQYLQAIDLMRNAPKPDSRAILAAYHRVGELALGADRAALGIEKMRLAADLAEDAGDRRALVTAVTLIGRLAAKAGRFGEALRHLTRALELSEGLTDLSLRRDILAAMGLTLTRNAEHIQAERYLSEAIDLAVATGDRDVEASLHLAVANARAARNDREGALASLAAAEGIIRAKGDMAELAEMYKTEGLIRFMLRDFDASVAASERALELAKNYDFAYLRAVCSHNIGDVLMRHGDFAKAFTYLYSSLQICEQEGFEKLRSLNMIFVGYIDAMRLRSDKALDQIRAGIRFAEEKGYVWDVIQGKFFLGRICFELGRMEEARAALGEALRLGRTTGNRVHADECEEMLSAIDALDAAGVR